MSFSATISLSGRGGLTLPYIEIDLPINSSFENASDASGSVSGTNYEAGNLMDFGLIVSGYIKAEASNNKLKLYFQNNYGSIEVRDPIIGVSGIYIVR